VPAPVERVAPAVTAAPVRAAPMVLLSLAA
jgi:hypothetical protein